MSRDECRDCGQTVLGERDETGRFTCYHCRKVAAERCGGEALRLFAPVETMPGQQVIS